MAKRGRQGSPVFDRVPPQNIEAEKAVLGAMLLNPEASGTAIEILKENAADVFYVEAHQHIYSAVVQLFRNNSSVDAVTILEQLDRDGRLEAAGGPSYVAELSRAVPTSANIEYYAKIVLDTGVLRRLIMTCTNLAGEAYNRPQDVNSLLDKAEANIFALAEKRQTNPVYHVPRLIPDAINRIEVIIRSHRGYTGLPTGFLKLDELTTGLQPSDMIVVAARPSVGKTAFALNVASHAAIRERKNVLIFSLEMSKEQLVQRLLCMEGGIDSRRLRSGFLARNEFSNVQRGASKLSNAPIYIDDSPGISILELRSKARRHSATTGGVDLVIIDYLQLMRAPGRSESRQVEIAEISRSVKGLARELSVPVMALSQLSREAEKDDTGEPKLQHLRESGAIEQDADVVLMLSRPPGYKRQGDGDDDDEAAHEKLIHVFIAKQRNGPQGKLDLFFDRNIQRFQDPARGMTEPAFQIAPHGSAAYDEDLEDEDDDGQESSF